ncbi:MAG: CubicO group peptidase (beta-lactamase class C family) [Planctomycetota bacterium]|jgi:CubicO group peptidase (beta-lactamase class C family)
MNRSGYASVSLILLLAQASASQEPAVAQADFSALRAALTSNLESAHVPGMAIAIVRDDKVVFAEGFGFADLELKRPATPETMFAIGSSSKAFTSAAIGMLVDEGKMEWDAPVTTYLPEFELAIDAQEDGDVLTVRDLLCHRTGFTRMGVLWASGKVDRPTIMATAGKAEPFAPFRKEFHYNNVMYLVAGEALGAASDSTWEDFVQARLVGPLKMTRSNLSISAAKKSPQLALGYRWNTEKEALERDPMRSLDAIAAAGAINSNVLDMSRWVRLQLGRGELEGERLISQQSLEDTWKKSIDTSDTNGYGLGWFVGTWRGHRMLQHGGNIDGFSAMVAFLPEENVGFCLLMNVGASSLQETCREMVFDALMGPDPTDAKAPEGAPAEDYSKLIGTYIANFGPFKEAEFKVQLKGEGLAIDIPGQMVFELKAPDDEGKYAFKIAPDEIQISFLRGEDDVVKAVVLYQSGMAFEVPRVGATQDVDGTEAEFAKYFGVYEHPKLPEPITVLYRNGRLVCDIPGQTIFDLRPEDAEGIWRFRATDDLGLQFVMDGTGRAASLIFHERGTEIPCPLLEVGTAALPSREDLAKLRDFTATSKAIEEWKTMRFEGEIHLKMAGVVGTIVTTCVGMDRVLNDISFGDFGWQKSAVDATSGWKASAFDPVEPLEGKFLEQARLSHPANFFGDWRDFFDDVQIVRMTEIDGVSCAVVQLSKEGLPDWSAFVSMETGDVMRVDTVSVVPGAGSLPQETRLGDYRDVDGIRIPFRISVKSPLGRTVVQYERVVPGIEVDPALFAVPKETGK